MESVAAFLVGESRSLRSCVSSSHRSNSFGPKVSRENLHCLTGCTTPQRPG